MKGLYSKFIKVYCPEHCNSYGNIGKHQKEADCKGCGWYNEETGISSIYKLGCLHPDNLL